MTENLKATMVSRDELEQRVIERTAQLEAANKELEAFSYSVSHDLRAPLRAIDGFSRIILEDYLDKLDDEGKRLLNVIGNNTQKMGQLIDDLLVFSRLGRQEISPSDIRMTELAKRVFEDIKPLPNERNLQFNIKTLPVAQGDRSLIKQVFANLLSNAIKFTRPKEMGSIEIGGTNDGAENIYYVKDNGVGFDMQYVDKLFGVFQRLHSAAEFEGTGVGLAIVQRIIHRHGGRVWAEGKVGEGATFYFSLPAKK
jgi:light-regulated signal transduction histidine kinase (bacteriophytochrome)